MELIRRNLKMEFSTELNEIFGALAKFRKDVSQPKKDASNPQFRSKYVDLENVTHAIDKVAPNYGLAYTQNVKSNDETVSVQTVITHESGQYIMFDELTLDARPVVKGGGIGRVTAHSTGSAITYGRRFTLSSAFGIASEVDDDGNAASGGEQTQPQQNQQQVPPENQKFDEVEGKKHFLNDTFRDFFQKHMTSQEYGAKLAQAIGVQDIYDAHLSSLVESSKYLRKQILEQSNQQQAPNQQFKWGQQQ